jgi:CRISPR/Cas system-associated endoribonuclease Cas2
MFVTSSSLSHSKSSTIIDASSDKKQSVFNAHIPFSAASSSVFAVSPGSVFSTQLNSLNLNEDKNELMERIKHEAKRLIKRKQVSLSAVQTSSTSTTPNENDVNNSKPSPDVVIIPAGKSVLHTSTNISLNETKTSEKIEEKTASKAAKAALNHNDVPIFSMNQVNVICERMMKEREQLIREQYDKILAQKLSEQYDAFVKFTHEQIQRRFESSQCSYVS